MPTFKFAPASTQDYRELAEKRLPRRLFDYIDGGAYSESTMEANVSDIQALGLKQLVMRDVSDVQTGTSLLGEDVAIPAALAPIGMGGMMARRAEVLAVRAADKFGIPFCLSTVGICSLEEVAAAASKPFWFQLYMMRDRGHVTELLERAKAVGCTKLVFTVDLAVVGARYRDVRNGMGGNVGAYSQLRAGLIDYLLHPQWLKDVALGGRPHTFGNLTQYVPKATTPADFAAWVNAQFDPSVTWKDIEWLRSVWDGDLVIKGVLTPEDALSAADAGANAVVVSNHGGRQLDGVPSAIKALPSIVDQAGDRLDVLMDSGIRSGLDIVKAVAYGAKGTLIGRPWIWSVAAHGSDGVSALLGTFKREMAVAMALTSTTRVDQLTREILTDR